MGIAALFMLVRARRDSHGVAINVSNYRKAQYAHHYNDEKYKDCGQSFANAFFGFFIAVHSP